MVSFAVPAGDGALTKNERKERYMAKTRAEASYLFKYLILTQIIVYLEAGSIPCLLDQLSVSLHLTATEQGALGGVVYLSLSAASPICAFFLHRFNPKYVLGLSLLLNNVAVLMLASVPTGYSFSANMMIFARALIGFTQAFPCIYTPLWVDEYAPREKVAGWMSYLQGSVPMGVMLGYFIGMVSNWVVPESFHPIETWRWPFLLQFVAMCPIIVAIFFVPKRHLLIRSEGDGSSSTGSIDGSAGSAHMDSTDEVSEESRTETKLAGQSEINGLLQLDEAKRTDLAEEELFKRSPPNSAAGDGGSMYSFAEDSSLVANTPSRSGVARNEEEDVMLVSASMYGGGSQRGLRQLHQNYQNHHHFGQYESDVGSASYPQSFNSSYRGSMLDTVAADMEAAASVKSAHEPMFPSAFSVSQVPARPPKSAAGANYGALDTMLTPIKSPTRSLMEASILEEEFMEGTYEQGSISDGIYELLHIPIFCLIVCGLTAVYFVVTGVQYWSTIFMIKTLHGSKYLVNVLFVFVAGTGPIFGVFYGGWLIDHYGGYIGVEQRAKSLGICMIMGVIAFIVSAVTTFFDDIYMTAAFLWLLLFFGGSILPACTGIFISVVPPQHRALASSFSVMVFNLMGYSLSPYLTGITMEWVLSQQGKVGSYFEDCDEACAYRIGFRFCLVWSLWSFICIGMAWRLALKQAAEAREMLAFYASSGRLTVEN